MTNVYIELENYLKKILEISKKIFNLLYKENEKNDDNLNKIDLLYEERRNNFKKIDELLVNNNLKKEDINKIENINELIKEILEIEDKNLKKIQEKVTKIGKEIKTLAQQKSILIYTKGENYERD